MRSRTGSSDQSSHIAPRQRKNPFAALFIQLASSEVLNRFSRVHSDSLFPNRHEGIYFDCLNFVKMQIKKRNPWFSIQGSDIRGIIWSYLLGGAFERNLFFLCFTFRIGMKAIDLALLS